MSNRIVNLGRIEAFKPALLKLDKLQALKVLEETAETVEAYKDWYKHGKTTERREEMLDEIADMIQSAANLITAAGITDEELLCAMSRCHERNAARGRYSDETTESKDDWDSQVDEEFHQLDLSDAKAAGR